MPQHPNRPLAPERVARLRELHAAGMSQIAIALECEVSCGTVSYHTFDLPAQSRGKPAKYVALASAMSEAYDPASGVGYHSVARQFGCSAMTASRWIRWHRSRSS